MLEIVWRALKAFGTPVGGIPVEIVQSRGGRIREAQTGAKQEAAMGHGAGGGGEGGGGGLLGDPEQ